MKKPDSRQKSKWSDAVSYFMNEQMMNQANESKLGTIFTMKYRISILYII